MTDYQNELVMEHLDLVNWVIRTRISVPNRPLLTYDDFYAIGCEAICRAALKYQADSGEFAPFACRYIYNAIMLPFENMVADYVKETGNHVMYRVTPIFEGDNLLANGVLMEGYSVEDKGAGVSYCVFAYNVQPGIEIDYATGESKLADSAQQEEQKTATVTPTPSPEPEKQEPATGSEASQADYILNTNTKKFHYPTCSSVNDMKEKNKQEFFGTRDEAISNGYSPCGRCKP